MIEQDVVLGYEMGLHCRPAAFFVQNAAKYANCEIWLEKDGQRVNGKSILGILMLAAERRSSIKVVADGEDEGAAVAVLAAVLAEGRLE